MNRWLGGIYIDTIDLVPKAIFYSEEDEGYIACLAEMPTLSAFGAEPNDAMKELEIALGLARGSV